MSLKEVDVSEISSRDHDGFPVLGTDFCSGFTDMFGKWNTGFDCPRAGNGETVFCCGTPTYKYCCTRRDNHSNSGISQSVLIGSALGSVLVICLVTLLSCFICRKCVPYRRAHPSLNGGPMYTMHCSSTTSGMYSYCQPSAITSPMESIVDMERPYTINTAMGPMMSNGCTTPSDPPPPYETEPSPAAEAPSGSSPSPNSFDLRSSRSGPYNGRPPGIGSQPQNNLYWQTKF